MNPLCMNAPATDPSPTQTMRSMIQRIATGPELSKDLTFEETRLGMQLVLNQSIDRVQAGIFLIALRMKRETDDENRGVLQALLDVTDCVTADVDHILHIADPYDGYTRALPVSPFLPAVLAACGVPCVSQGAESVGPKYGATHRKVLRAAGAPVDLTPQSAAARVSNPDIGWSYVDQRMFCPKLHELVDLRSLIVKRPCITTVEVLLASIRGRRTTHLMTGYVHKPYPRIYVLLARHAGFDSALIVRGVEGGVVASLQQPSKCVYYRGNDAEQEQRLTPAELGIASSSRAVPLPDNLPSAIEQPDSISSPVDADLIAQAAAEVGIDALRGKTGPASDSLIYSAAIYLKHAHPSSSLMDSAETVRGVLKSGAALARFVE